MYWKNKGKKAADGRGQKTGLPVAEGHIPVCCSYDEPPKLLPHFVCVFLGDIIPYIVDYVITFLLIIRTNSLPGKHFERVRSYFLTSVYKAAQRSDRKRCNSGVKCTQKRTKNRQNGQNPLDTPFEPLYSLRNS